MPKGPSVTAGQPERTVRIASYNLRALRDDTAAAAEVVRVVDPDVLLLQEVPRHPASSYRISAFARDAGLMWSGRGHRLAGTSVLTGLGVMATDVVDHPIPVPLGGNPRTYSLTRVSAPGAGTFTAVSVHLPLEAGLRLAHVQRLLHDLDEDPLTDTDLLVVGGDLNEGPDGAAWELLASRLRPVGPEAATYPAARPQHRIDALFAGPGLRVADRGGPAPGQDRMRAASDHLPVWVDLGAPPA